MNIIMPILIASLVLGLGVRRIKAGHWVALSVWITMVVAYHYVKH